MSLSGLTSLGFGDKTETAAPAAIELILLPPHIGHLVYGKPCGLDLVCEKPFNPNWVNEAQ